jgi:hypothetical protein
MLCHEPRSFLGDGTPQIFGSLGMESAAH